LVEIPALQPVEFVMDQAQMDLLAKEAREAENATIDDADEDI
jgi:hypothetical protein